jgi:hypothetical protein
MSLGSSGKSRSHEKRFDFRHRTSALRRLVEIAERKSQQIHSELGGDALGCCRPLDLVASSSRTVRFLQRRIAPSLDFVRREARQLAASGGQRPPPTLRTVFSSGSDVSVKLAKLDELLREVRK